MELQPAEEFQCSEVYFVILVITLFAGIANADPKPSGCAELKRQVV
jgi:hypothetical protein